MSSRNAPITRIAAPDDDFRTKHDASACAVQRQSGSIKEDGLSQLSRRPLFRAACRETPRDDAITSPVRISLRLHSIIMKPSKTPETRLAQAEIVQKRAARLCLNDYAYRDAGCGSEMLKQLHLQQLITT